jgi:secreted PhoX family phosphatase
MLNRRRFLQTIIVAATVPSTRAATAEVSADVRFGRLVPDADRILDLPQDFSYRVISRYGEEMDDGLLVPARHDGMAAFPGNDGSTLLMCNHENPARVQRMGAFGAAAERLDRIDRSKVYDFGKGSTPGTGGTTTIVYDTALRQRKRIHLSLAGTEINCAGGPTPWGSWLSCEEIFRDPGSSFEWSGVVNREKKHGYVLRAVGSSAIERYGPFRTRSCSSQSGDGYRIHDRRSSPEFVV